MESRLERHYQQSTASCGATHHKCEHILPTERPVKSGSMVPWHHSGWAAHFGEHLLKFAHLLHHLLHLREAVEQRVQFRNRHAAAFGDPLPPAGVENLRTAALLEC